MSVLASATQPAPRRLDALRRLVADIERGTQAETLGGPAPLSIGIEAIDAALGGGLVRGACHVVHEAGAGEAMASVAFVTLLAARAACTGPVVWVQTEASRREEAALHGAGLAMIGFPPERLLLVRAADDKQALWAAEEALVAGAPSAVVLETRGEAPLLDMTASRRLSLAAARTGALGLIVRVGAAPRPLAVATRFLVAPAASRAGPAEAIGGLGPARLAVSLDRNRAGPRGLWHLEWTGAPSEPHVVSFAIASAPKREVGRPHAFVPSSVQPDLGARLPPSSDGPVPVAA